jgi:hypothetical protein
LKSCLSFQNAGIIDGCVYHTWLRR